MYCPNCGETNAENQKYCRGCGLGLGKITKDLLAELRVLSGDDSFFNARLFSRLSRVFLYAFLAVGFGFIFALAVYYKFLIFGIEMMGLFGIFGFLLLGALSAIFYGVQKYISSKTVPAAFPASAETAELGPDPQSLEAGTIESARSVTENTTEPLKSEVIREDRR